MKKLLLALSVVVLLAAPASAQPDRSSVVNAVHAANPHLLQSNTHRDNGEFLCLVLAAMPEPWTFISKDGGENGVVINGVKVSHDVIRHDASGRQVDIITGAGNHPHPGGPSWGPIDPVHYRPGNVPVSANICGVVKPPPVVIPPPTPPVVDIQPVLDAIAALSAKLDALAESTRLTQDAIREVDARVDRVHLDVLVAVDLGRQVLARPDPEYRGGWLVGTLRPVRP